MKNKRKNKNVYMKREVVIGTDPEGIDANEIG